MEIQGKSILIIEDEESLRSLLSKILFLEGLQVFEAGDVSTGLEIIQRENIYVVVTDVMLPDTNGIEFTKQIKNDYPGIEVIVLTAYGNVKDGVNAMKIGAFDYITKGDGDDKLPLVVTKAVEKAALNRQVQEMEHRLNSKSSFAKIIGKSNAILQMIELAKKVAVTDTTVLLLGETGTGKELLAEAIHLASRRRKGPFIPINCAAIPKDLQESELFGHKKGAFTGAHADKKGYLEVADRGTIFLDEVGEMSPDLQAKLLRTLENKIIYRVGDPTPVPVDLRIVAATNKTLLEEESNDMANSTFRKDLYYRLSTFTIDLPPLRERVDDIELLAHQFMLTNAEKLNKKVKGMDKSFVEYLKMHSWPGNIRELKNVIERAVILCENQELTVETLPQEMVKAEGTTVGQHAGQENGEPTLAFDKLNLKAVEQEHIQKVLEMVDGNKSEAAKKLNIGLATLYRKIKEYNLEE